MSKRIVNITGQEIARRLSALQGKSLSEIYYFDGLDDYSKPYFEYDASPERHELMWGVDLVANDGTCVGLTWDMNGRLGEYGLFVQPGGLAEMHGKGTPRIEQTFSPQWAKIIGKPIEGFAISKPTKLSGKIPYCDCRIDFKDGPSVWICTRCSGTGLQDCGDDCVVVFTDREARRIGIKIQESPAG